MKFRAIAAAAALALASTSASATIVSITLSGGTATGASIIAAPSAVNLNTGTELVGWTAKADFLATSNFPYGLAAPGFTNPQKTITGPISSHVFAMNTTGLTASGTIVFNQNVRRIIVNGNTFNHPHNLQLQNAGTNYASFANLETPDTQGFTFVNDKTITFSLSTVTGGADNFAVITAVPEAPTWAMLITGFGLVGLGSRRRRATSVAA